MGGLLVQLMLPTKLDFKTTRKHNLSLAAGIDLHTLCNGDGQTWKLFVQLDPFGRLPNSCRV